MKPLTPQQLRILSAWWHTGSVVAAARLLGIKAQTAKNTLAMARARGNVGSTLLLAQQHLGELLTAGQIHASHNTRRREAA